MLERFYPTHIFPRITTSEDAFWDNRGLSVGDWAGLAGLLYSELFSLDVLTPLDDQDTSFKLEPHPQADLGRYTEMVHSTQLGKLTVILSYISLTFSLTSCFSSVSISLSFSTVLFT